MTIINECLDTTLQRWVNPKPFNIEALPVDKKYIISTKIIDLVKENDFKFLEVDVKKLGNIITQNTTWITLLKNVLTRINNDYLNTDLGKARGYGLFTRLPDPGPFTTDKNNLFFGRFLEEQNLLPNSGYQSWIMQRPDDIADPGPTDWKSIAGIQYNDPFNPAVQIPSTPTAGAPRVALTYPKTPILPLGSIYLEDYLYLDIFRIFKMIREALRPQTPIGARSIGGGEYYVPGDIPIFKLKINEWVEYVDEMYDPVSNPYGYSLEARQKYPALLLCEKIFYRLAQIKIKKLLEDCYNQLITMIRDSTINNPNINLIKKLFRPQTESYMYSLILPSYSDPSEPAFDILLGKNFPNDEQKTAFDIFFNNIPNKSEIINIFSTLFGTANLNNLSDIRYFRKLIDSFFLRQPTIIAPVRNILQNTEYINFTNQLIEKYNIRNPMYKNFVSTIDFIIHGPSTQYELVVDSYLKSLTAPNPIDKIFKFNFVTEINLYCFTNTLKKIMNSYGEIQKMDTILNDIIQHIEQYTEYFIPQIFLPALIRQLFIIYDNFRNILEYIDTYAGIYTKIFDVLNPLDEQTNNVMTLFTVFNEHINKLLGDMHKKLIIVIRYHNDIINYLHKKSVHTLLKYSYNKTVGLPLPPIENLFIGMLSEFEDIFGELTDVLNFDAWIIKKFAKYRINNVTYYSGIAPKIDPTIFDFENIGTFPKRAIYYRDFMSLARSSSPTKESGIVSSTAPIDNWQCIIEQIAGGYALDSGKSIEGEWINFDPVDSPLRATNIKFHDAFIKFSQTAYPLDLIWTTGMPPSIKSFLDDHLIMQKQRIIEIIIQHIIDTKDTTSKDTYDKLLTLATEFTYDEINKTSVNDIIHTKAYCLIGKITDSIINEMITYSTKQSIHNWIYSKIKTDSKYDPIVNTHIINIIQQKPYMKISPGDVEKSIIESIYKSHQTKFIQSKIPQIEPDPLLPTYFADQNKIQKKKILDKNNELVTYLYNINYFSEGAGPQAKCYDIDLQVVAKLITSKNINLQNADGQTALHFAVQMHRPDLVKLLCERGAKPHSFKNFKQFTPVELIDHELSLHLNLIPIITNKISDFVGGFANPFNDLLVARLRDEKYSNNIIKGIKYAIPICLCIYQHMFKVYIQNYKFGISPKLKNKINDLCLKYHTVNSPIYDYPIDLFDTRDDEMDKIFLYADTKNTSKRFINTINKKKIKEKNDMIIELQFQIDGLTKEKNVTTDPDKIRIIDMALDKLNKSKTTYETDIIDKLEFEPSHKEIKLKNDAIVVLETNIKNLTNQKIFITDNIELAKINEQIAQLQTAIINLKSEILSLKSKPKIKFDIGLYGSYLGSVERAKKLIDSRTWSVTEFYDEMFKKIGRTQELHFGIWLNYMDMPLDRAPSMIFIVMNDILRTIQSNLSTNKSDIIADLSIIKEFMIIVKTYIDRRDDLPDNLDDNPVLEADKDRIIFLINLIISEPIYNIILGQISKSISESDASKTLFVGNKQNDIMEEITKTKFNGDTIQSYIQNKLPTLAFKYCTQFYQNKFDPARKILQDAQLFDPIISIIKQNTAIMIDDNSILIKNFTQYLIPFMMNTYRYTIHHLRLAIFGFEKYLLNTYQLVEIYSLFVENN